MNAGYRPESFCAEYVETRGSSGLLMLFMATALGIKRAYDDWLPAGREEKLKRVCRKYKLHCVFDWVFVPARDVSNVISGAGRLPTTQAFGMPFRTGARYPEGASVHVFISRSKQDAELCFRNGWYPLILKNRAIHKPFIDHMRFGYFLGYPDCCIDYFRRYNNHFKYNYLFEALKNTRTAPRLSCNPLLKNFTYSYIYHMPCAYDCARTMAYVRRLRKEISLREPELVRRIDRMLALPLLVMGEQDAYVFEGRVRGQEVEYTDCALVGSGPRLHEALGGALARGNRVRVEGRSVRVFAGGDEIFHGQSRFGAFIMQCVP